MAAAKKTGGSAPLESKPQATKLKTAWVFHPTENRRKQLALGAAMPVALTTGRGATGPITSIETFGPSSVVITYAAGATHRTEGTPKRMIFWDGGLFGELLEEDGE